MDDAILEGSIHEIKNILTQLRIPNYMHEGMVNYIVYHRPVGSFLTAILENNLLDAANRADEANKHLLWEYAWFLFNFAPRQSFGNKERVAKWLESGKVLSGG